jgi:hypothetical protein
MGYFSPVVGAAACLLCDPGSYCGENGLAAASGLCAAGYYCTGGSTSSQPVLTLAGPSGQSMGGRCPVGHFCPEGAVHAVPCTPGAACTRQGLPAPDATCQAGYYCRSTASTATPTDDALEGQGGNRCRPGFYCPAGSAWPVPCSPGTYNPDYLAQAPSACRACPARTHCASAGLAAPTGYCEAGYFCAAGATSSRPAAGLCPAGHYCVLGSAEAVACAAGTFQPRQGSVACVSCPAGYKCTATAKEECGTDHYCPAG